ncbi:glutaredoxin family protein [Pectinatus sottacetonis]|uniref:glutaredoxin family protein n=1 Tax=Pectinatus sottacetonis TaxID=1002795 RepID=UPI0018C4AFE7|nr:thioredoxin family protein [Pectinatus sottacetonis]
MKTITAFYLADCPYCHKAKKAIKELIMENQAYSAISIQWHEENEDPSAIKGYEYYYVPSLFIGREKLYEAQPGQSYEEIKSYVKAALDKALA